jgi:hypothetical protein
MTLQETLPACTDCARPGSGRCKVQSLQRLFHAWPRHTTDGEVPMTTSLCDGSETMADATQERGDDDDGHGLLQGWLRWVH